jgi:hypothetical protein
MSKPNYAIANHNTRVFSEMSISELVSVLMLDNVTRNTYVYIDNDGALCAIEKPDRMSYPIDEFSSIGYFNSHVDGVKTAQAAIDARYKEPSARAEVIHEAIAEDDLSVQPPLKETQWVGYHADGSMITGFIESDYSPTPYQLFIGWAHGRVETNRFVMTDKRRNAVYNGGWSIAYKWFLDIGNYDVTK